LFKNSIYEGGEWSKSADVVSSNNFEAFVDDSVAPPSPTKSSSKGFNIDEIISSISYDNDNESSNSNNSSSVEDATHLFTKDVPSKPTSSSNPSFNEELSIGIQILAS